MGNLLPVRCFRQDDFICGNANITYMYKIKSTPVERTTVVDDNWESESQQKKPRV